MGAVEWSNGALEEEDGGTGGWAGQLPTLPRAADHDVSDIRAARGCASGGSSTPHGREKKKRAGSVGEQPIREAPRIGIVCI